MIWIRSRPVAVLIFCTATAISWAEEESPPKNDIVQITESLGMDTARRCVILDAEVVLTEGPLELLVCPRRTKEHESILSADVAPRSFQLALLGVGAEPGHPAEFEPQFKPPTGQSVLIEVEYSQDGQRRRIDAREWIRPVRREGDAKAAKFEADFVFAGSRFIKVPGERRARWLGDDGDIVCVANFPGAVIDVAVESGSSNDSLLFEAWTERIPPKGTKVKVIFTPSEKFEKKEEK